MALRGRSVVSAPVSRSISTSSTDAPLPARKLTCAIGAGDRNSVRHSLASGGKLHDLLDEVFGLLAMSKARAVDARGLGDIVRRLDKLTQLCLHLCEFRFAEAGQFGNDLSGAHAADYSMEANGPIADVCEH